MSKLILLSVLCTIVFFGTAANLTAQNLTASESSISRSEVDKLIKFYEWAFESEFTRDERERYRQFVAENLRKDPATSRRYADTLLSVLEKILAKDAAAQAKIRTVFNEDAVKELRSSNDEGSRMLLGVFERGQ